MTYQEQNHYNNTTTNSSTTTTTTIYDHSSSSSIYTEPGVSILSREQWEQLAEYYEGCVGSPITLPMANYIKEANIEGGIHFEVFMEALTETGMARKPSGHYFRAIIERAIGDGIETIEDWKKVKHEYRQGKPKWWTPVTYW